MANNQFQAAADQAREMAEDLKNRAEDTMQDMPSGQQMQKEAQGRAVDVMRRAEQAPDSFYLIATIASMAISLALLLGNRRHASLFIGLWPVTILNLAMLMKNRRPSREMDIMAGPSTPAGVQGHLLAE